MLDTFNTSPSGLTSRQLARWQILDNEYSDDTLYVIPQMDFSQIGSDGRFKISLPGGCQNMEFKTKRAEYYANGDLNFIAEAEERDTCECNCNLGDFTYVKKDSISIGMIIADGRAYEIRDLKEGKLCLRTVKGTEEIVCPHEDTEEELRGGENSEDAIQLRDQCCPVSILILHDAQANILGDIAARATMDLILTNEALRNSGVAPCYLRFGIVAIDQYDLLNPNPATPIADLIDVRIDNQALRNQLAADIVVFYTAAVDYQVGGFDIAGAALGIVNEPGVFVANPVEDAYALVEATGFANARLTFPHEVAHLFLCRHENDPNGTFQHGHSFKVGCGGLFCSRPRLRTILHTLPDPTRFDRILHFSNPNVKFRRKETGVDGSRNNALQLRNLGCTVAAFRLAGDPLMATISGPSEVCLYSSVTFTAEIGGDAPEPYTYVWETATSILGPYQVVSTNPTVTLYGSGIIGEIIYIRLRVTSNDNQVAEEFQILECVGPVGISCEQSLAVDEDTSKMTAALPGLHWFIFPNPAQNDLELNILLEQPYTSLKIDLLDQNGRLIEGIGFREMEKGKHSTHFDISNQPSGLYLIRITSPYGLTGTTIIKH